MSLVETALVRLGASDSLFLDRLRGISVSRVVLGHLGLFWLFPPYTGFLMALLPLLFFVSGAVTFLSWRRSESDIGFVTRRLIGIFIPYWIFIILALIYHSISAGELPAWDARDVMDWLLINPSADKSPFPVGQVWFLHALAIMVVLSPVVFRCLILSRTSVFAFVGLGLVAGATQHLFRLDRLLMIEGHNTYQALSNLGFFGLGAAYFGFVGKPGPKVLGGLLAFSLLIVIVSGYLIAPEIDYKFHSYAPDLYYLSGCYVALLAFLLLQRPVSRLIDVAWPIDKVLRFVSSHSFSIFLLHSFFIFASETWLGLVDVRASPGAAVLKIILVVCATGIAAVPFSWACRSVTRRVDRMVTAWLR